MVIETSCHNMSYTSPHQCPVRLSATLAWLLRTYENDLFVRKLGEWYHEILGQEQAYDVKDKQTHNILLCLSPKCDHLLLRS